MNQTVLVIDDESCHARLAGFALMEEGFDVIAAADGPEGIEKAKVEKPDLIILDVKMPGMDGYEVIQHLKTDPDYTQVPIILFTGMFQQINKFMVHTIGAAGVIAKPADPSVIVSKVKQLLLSEFEQTPKVAMCQ